MFKQWFYVDLTVVPKSVLHSRGFVRGFQSLEDDTEVFYQMWEFYHPAGARRVRFDVPAFRIRWWVNNPFLSPKDFVFEDLDS